MNRIPEYEGDDSVEDMLRGCAFEANTERHLKGKKGQAALRELEAALLVLPEKRVAQGVFVTRSGEVCPLGALALKRKLDQGKTREQALLEIRAEMGSKDDERGEEFEEDANWSNVTESADVLGLKENFTFAVMDAIDDCFYHLSPEQRYERMLQWVRDKILPAAIAQEATP